MTTALCNSPPCFFPTAVRLLDDMDDGLLLACEANAVGDRTQRELAKE